ncbi:MAG TPA: cyanophycin synthetase, partial [bacterium]
DEPGVAGLIPNMRRTVITYGLNEKADVRALGPTFAETQTRFRVAVRGRERGELEINLPGLHNVKNALAAVGVAEELGIAFSTVQRGLKKFRGVERRFEIKGEARGIMVVDDYAHHPTEIKATLAAAKRGWNRRVVAVFQPHLYTRTRDFAADFGASFKDADLLIVTEIYGAREQPIAGVTGEMIVKSAIQAGHQNVLYVPDKSEIPQELNRLCRAGDIVITLGAGDIWKIAREFFSRLEK